MRKFLYITPYFPPQSQVGALRPLKFVRHLPATGWLPVVLADLWPTDGMDPALSQFVPPEVPVHYDYSHRAAKTWAALLSGELQKKRTGNTVARAKPLHERILPQWLQDPELLPLGEHTPDMPHAYRAALRILRENPDIEAILVNADPFAASVVGAQLHRKTGLPLIQDFRDIWAPCKLRRPRRMKPQLWLEDKLEQFCVENAAHMVINTQVSLDDYWAFYPEMPRDKFSLIRNFYDAELVSHGAHAGFDRYTLLHLGNFSRFRIADPLVRAVARALELGVPPDALQVVSTGAFGEAALQLAEELGVRALFKAEPPVPYHQVGALCQAADLLVYIAEPDADQRIASKFYDYLGARRPVLSVSDNPESGAILQDYDAGAQFLLRDTEGMAQYMLREFTAGRQRVVDRSVAGLTAPEAAASLAAILNQVTGKG
jgi:hypothetical protein